jgi:hypothetical protein
LLPPGVNGMRLRWAEATIDFQPLTLR